MHFHTFTLSGLVWSGHLYLVQCTTIYIYIYITDTTNYKNTASGANKKCSEHQGGQKSAIGCFGTNHPASLDILLHFSSKKAVANYAVCCLLKIRIVLFPPWPQYLVQPTLSELRTFLVWHIQLDLRNGELGGLRHNVGHLQACRPGKLGLEALQR